MPPPCRQPGTKEAAKPRFHSVFLLDAALTVPAARNYAGNSSLSLRGSRRHFPLPRQRRFQQNAFSLRRRVPGYFIRSMLFSILKLYYNSKSRYRRQFFLKKNFCPSCIPHLRIQALIPARFFFQKQSTGRSDSLIYYIPATWWCQYICGRLPGIARR